jgi:hypothetical protein
MSSRNEAFPEMDTPETDLVEKRRFPGNEQTGNGCSREEKINPGRRHSSRKRMSLRNEHFPELDQSKFRRYKTFFFVVTDKRGKIS